jgi:hypothetical protein
MPEKTRGVKVMVTILEAEGVEIPAGPPYGLLRRSVQGGRSMRAPVARHNQFRRRFRRHRVGFRQF